ncbi:hypothetical protein WJX73_002511 [Symbiochloris irregularis]|uniref:ENTH domain-containing protein n=1 Tax=Symbiochloris irregularis TaxID=706552 RepID=A0AAW1NTF3_9CHLO
MVSQQRMDQAYGLFKGLANRAKQYAYNLSEIELKVEDATSNEAWGPTGSQMSEITKASYDSESFKQIMEVLARRLQDQGEDWRHVYKSLLLLEYMAKHGPQKIVDELVSNVNVIEKLQTFQYKDKNGRDWGLNVRQRAKEITALVGDAERMRAERAKAKANETKYTGVSSDDMRGSGGGGGFRKQSSFSSGGGFGTGGYSSGGLGSLGGGGLGAGKGLGSGSRPYGNDRYDDSVGDDHDYSHIRAADPMHSDAQSMSDAVAETQKRIAALRHDTPPRSDSNESAKLAAAGKAAPEAKAPKKLSEVKVNPSIAAAFGAGGRLPSPAPPAAASSQAAATKAPAAAAGGFTDLLGGLDSHAPAPAQAPAPVGNGASPGGKGEDMWSSFANSRGANTAAAPPARFSEGGAFGDGGDPFGGPVSAPPQHSSAQDPFAMPAAAPAASAADPFAAMSGPPAHSHAAPALPAKPSDPFASLGGAPAPSHAMKPQAASSHPTSSADPFSNFGGVPTRGPGGNVASNSPAGSPGGGAFGAFSSAPQAPPAAASKSSMIGQPLPEDIFSAGPPVQPPTGGASRPQMMAGHGGSYLGGVGFQNSPQHSPQHAFGARPQMQQQQQQPFGGSSFGGQQGFGGPAAFQGAYGGGPSISVGGGDFSSSPGHQHVTLPPAPPKNDPFAGLSGF